MPLFEKDARRSIWTIRDVECLGGAGAEALQDASDAGRSLSGERLHEACGDGEPEDLAWSLESHAYVDGLGRARMSLAEADTSRGDAGEWVRSGLVSFDAKGGAAREYLPDFQGQPDFAPALPTSRYASTAYDALGRPLTQPASELEAIIGKLGRSIAPSAIALA